MTSHDPLLHETIILLKDVVGKATVDAGTSDQVHPSVSIVRSQDGLHVDHSRAELARLPTTQAGESLWLLFDRALGEQEIDGVTG
jgi:hypothetical protein